MTLTIIISFVAGVIVGVGGLIGYFVWDNSQS
jgi:predicted negative regulator of RcsB-dependent stress response